MGHPQIAAFARVAKENTLPKRLIAGQITELSRGAHDIRYDPVNDEIWIANPHATAILVFRGAANGAEPPIRVIQGDKTQLQLLDRLDIDTVHNEIFVPDENQVLVFSREANGNVPPIRVIKGPDTLLRRSKALAVDPVHNLIAVAAEEGKGVDRKANIVIFNRTDEGNAAPRAVIRGPRVGSPNSTEHAIGQMQTYPPKGWIIVTIPGSLYSWGSTNFIPFVGIWSINDNGDVPPRWKLGGPKSTLKRPRGVVLEPKNKELIVADMHQNAVLTFYFPEIF